MAPNQHTSPARVVRRDDRTSIMPKVLYPLYRLWCSYLESCKNKIVLILDAVYLKTKYISNSLIWVG